jgi:hypothetical protein
LEELDIGGSYTLQEVSSPFGEKVQLASVNFTIDRPHKELAIESQITQTDAGYGG